MSDGFEELQDRLFKTRTWAWDAIGVSAHNLDFFHLVDSIDDDETAATEAGSFAGGSAANTIFALSRLGCRTAVTGIVADDDAGNSIMVDLQREGVNCSLILQMPKRGGATGHTRIFSDERGVGKTFVTPGLNESFAAHLAGDPETKSRILASAGAARILHFSSFTGHDEMELTEELIEAAPEEAVVSLTPGSIYGRLGIDRLARVLVRTNLLFLNEAQLDALLTRRAAFNPKRMALHEKLHLLYEARAVMGTGEPLMVAVKKALAATLPPTIPGDIELAYGRTRLDSIVPAARVAGDWPTAERSDMTGAKDAMAAGVMLGLLKRMDVNETVDLGYAMALLAARKVGAREALPSLAELSSFCAIRIA
jgi:ribokinase